MKIPTIVVVSHRGLVGIYYYDFSQKYWYCEFEGHTHSAAMEDQDISTHVRDISEIKEDWEDVVNLVLSSY